MQIMHKEYCDYTDGDVTCEAFVAMDRGRSGKKPAVLISHSWTGQSDIERGKAEKMAELGYIGIAIDIYGKGRRGNNPEENARLMQPFLDDRAMLRRRLLAALTAAKAMPEVDPDRIAAIGFCFGGLCVLDLARSTAPGVKGVVSFHGLFHPPALGPQDPISAKILVCHGFDDPMATPEQGVELGRELTAAKADWQMINYGNTAHAFTNPHVDMPESGIKYQPSADRRSWALMKDFLSEVLV